MIFCSIFSYFLWQGAIDESGNYISSDHNGVIRKGEYFWNHALRDFLFIYLFIILHLRQKLIVSMLVIITGFEYSRKPDMVNYR